MNRLVLASFFWTRAARFRLQQPRPKDDVWVRVVGLEPIRVLIVGAGLAAGYGVERHRDTVAGPLAELLAEQFNQGVSIETRAVPLMPAANALQVIGPIGAHTFDIVVFAGCYLEARFAPQRTLSGRLGEVVDHLTATGGPRLRIAITALPVPTRDGRIDSALAHHTEQENQRMQAALRGRPRVTFVQMPSYRTAHASRPFDREYYEQAAHHIHAALEASRRS